MTTIDLNADLGEGFGRWTLTDDEGLLDIVTSANVACGFHAGDPTIMLRVCRAAAERGVAVGAQVGYRDLAGFGRRFLDVAPADLTADVLYQIGALDACARAAGTRVSYVKPHGALYNTAVHHDAQAAAVVAAVVAYDAELDLVGLPGSALLTQGDAAGLRVVPEGFVDRGYRDDGTLVPRSEPSALIDPAQCPARAVSLALRQRIATVSGGEVDAHVRTLCVHGDSPVAVGVARAVRDALSEAGVTVRAVVAS